MRGHCRDFLCSCSWPLNLPAAGKVAGRRSKAAVREEVLNIREPVDVVNFKKDDESIHLSDAGNPEQTLNVIVRNKERIKLFFEVKHLSVKQSFNFSELFILKFRNTG